MIIGISGLPGSGVSTVSSILASTFPNSTIKSEIPNDIFTFHPKTKNLILKNLTLKQLKILSKRPFFIHLHINADPITRLKRFPTKCQKTLLEIDSACFLSMIQLAKFATANLVNVGSLEDLEEVVKGLDLFGEEWRRPSWDQYFIKLAVWASRRSNCMKRRVGAIIINSNKQIISTGYNGTPRGIKNCNEGGCSRCNSGLAKGGEGLDDCLCLHAEENALLEVGRERVQGGTLFCTTHPCLSCAKKIIQVGVRRVVYRDSYTAKSDLVTARLFSEAKVEICLYTPFKGDEELVFDDEREMKILRELLKDRIEEGGDKENHPFVGKRFGNGGVKGSIITGLSSLNIS